MVIVWFQETFWQCMYMYVYRMSASYNPDSYSAPFYYVLLVLFSNKSVVLYLDTCVCWRQVMTKLTSTHYVIPIQLNCCTRFTCWTLFCTYVACGLKHILTSSKFILFTTCIQKNLLFINDIYWRYHSICKEKQL